MKPARIAVLAIALAAGLGAAILASGSKPSETAPPPLPPPVVSTDDVLVAAKELSVGIVIDATGLRWDAWPKDHIPEGFIRKSVFPNSIEELKGYMTRANFAPGEPLRRERLSKGPGFLAADLQAGMRAVAISIDPQGSSTAGGFILRDDRVDVIHTFRDEDAARKGTGNPFVSQTILTNVRVLAIGQNDKDENKEHNITGVNATLELTPAQAETITLAQKTGLLSLALRSVKDANAASGQLLGHSSGFVVMRNGVASR